MKRLGLPASPLFSSATEDCGSYCQVFPNLLRLFSQESDSWIFFYACSSSSAYKPWARSWSVCVMKPMNPPVNCLLFLNTTKTNFSHNPSIVLRLCCDPLKAALVVPNKVSFEVDVTPCSWLLAEIYCYSMRPYYLSSVSGIQILSKEVFFAFTFWRVCFD